MKKKTAYREENMKQEGLLNKMNSFFEQNEKFFLWLSLFCGAIMSFLMFDSKVSLSGDDCDYIVNAQQFIKHFRYPAGRGSLYPIVISPFLTGGGLNLILLKALSAVFILLSMWFMYKAFKGKIPAAVLMPAFFIANICPYIFFYASHTYSEPLFMLVQSLFLYLFSKYFWNGQSASYQIKEDWSKYIMIGLAMLAIGLTRTVGFAVAGSVILYFCFEKQWKNLLYSLTAFGIVYAVFSFVKTLVWPDSGAAYSIVPYLAKDFYNVERGMEDFSGFVRRLSGNSNVYLSCFLYQFMGLRSVQEGALEFVPLLSIVTYVIFFVWTVILSKKNKPLFYTGLYTGVMNFASFILLQTNWMQDRLIMIYYPLILIFLLGGLYYILKETKLVKMAWIYPLVLLSLLIGTGIHLKAKVKRHLPVLQENMLGNDLYGYTPDWENFVKMSRWANDNLDKEAVIASRKPSISYIYTGRKFSGIFRVPGVAFSDVIKQNEEEKAENVFVVLPLPAKGAIVHQLSPFLEYTVTTMDDKGMAVNGKTFNSLVIYKIEKRVSEPFLNALRDSEVNHTLDYDGFLKQFTENKISEHKVTSPDMLLEDLRKRHIKYLLLPKLRVYPPKNTGKYITTVHNYIEIIGFKYPRKFRLIHTIGKDETCELVEFSDE